MANNIFNDSVINFFSGGIAGCIAKTAIAPLDRVKIFYQTKNVHYNHYNSTLTTMNKVVEKEGFFHLWKGNTATVIRIFPYAAIQFMAYEKLKILLLDSQNNSPKPILHMVCGALAGVVATVTTYPLDLVRTRLACQIDHRTYRNTFHALSVMQREEGVSSWLKGLKPTLQGIIPYAGVNFAVFETLKFYAPKNENGELSTTYKLLCGGIAGATGQTVSYPLDVIRRRTQIAGFSPGVEEVPFRSTMHSMKTIAQNEGIRALFRGISINYWKVVPAVSISFTVYETLTFRFKEWRDS